MTHFTKQSRLLGQLVGANMNTTSDQAIPIECADKYVITKIFVTNPSASLTTCVGVFYTGAGKTGITLVAAAQVYTALVNPIDGVSVTLATGASNKSQTAQTIFFSLTTGQGTAQTADIFVWGDVLA